MGGGNLFHHFEPSKTEPWLIIKLVKVIIPWHHFFLGFQVIYLASTPPYKSDDLFH
jgi:hypothetical protein